MPNCYEEIAGKIGEIRVTLNFNEIDFCCIREFNRLAIIGTEFSN